MNCTSATDFAPAAISVPVAGQCDKLVRQHVALLELVLHMILETTAPYHISVPMFNLDDSCRVL